VADDQAKAKLLADGVSEAIYTVAEAQEFNKLPAEQKAYVNMVKAGLSGTVEQVVTDSSILGSQTTKPPDDWQTCKYRVLQSVELHGHSYKPGDVIALTIDDAQALVKDGTVQATCWWSRSGDVSSAGYTI
jgi:hypothetical protein